MKPQGQTSGRPIRWGGRWLAVGAALLAGAGPAGVIGVRGATPSAVEKNPAPAAGSAATVPAAVGGKITFELGGLMESTREAERLRAAPVAPLSPETVMARVRAEEELLAAQRVMAQEQAELKRLGEEWAARQAQDGAEGEKAAVNVAAAPPPQVWEVKDLDRMPVPRFQARPRYPAKLRQSGVSGEVLVDFFVDAQGAVSGAHVVQATHEDFGRAAVEAVSFWRFRPARKDDRDVATRVQVPIVFSISEKPPK